jgi:hypothetical protein
MLLLGLALLSAKPVSASTITFVTGSQNGTQPTINDSGEVVWGLSGVVISNQRGVLVPGGVDFSNLGISNSGEVVYAVGTISSNSRVFSTTLGLLSDPNVQSYGPTIAPTSGEVVYVTGSSIISTTRGVLVSATPGVSIGVADVNDNGEVVYEYRLLDQPNTQIVSTLRGFLTPIDVNAIQPSINNLGEVVWTQTGIASLLGEAIFSSLRGQITGGHLPDISNDGTIAFSNISSGAGPNGIYLFEDHPSPVPLRSSVVVQLYLGRPTCWLFLLTQTVGDDHLFEQLGKGIAREPHGSHPHVTFAAAMQLD